MKTPPSNQAHTATQQSGASPCKLLFVVNDPAFFLSHRLPVARAAQNAGYDVHVATPDASEAEQVRAEGFTFHRFPLSRKGTHPVAEFRSFLAVYRLLRRLRPDLIHTVTIKPTLYGGIAARLAGVPSQVNALSGLGHIFLARGLRAAVLRATVKAAYRLALRHRNGQVIFQNPDDKAAFESQGIVSGHRAVLIRGSGVNLTIFRPVPEKTDELAVGLVGRMLWQKGVGDFVAAARQLKKNGVRARFLLIGDEDPGNPSSVPTAQLTAWHREGIVEWLGQQQDMPELLSQLNLVCLPSYREGVPKALIEAAACGRPIVTTDVPGCREVVHHEKNGLLVPLKNPDRLAAAIHTLLDDPDLRTRMGAKGRQLAEAEFSEQRVVEETLRLYTTLQNTANTTGNGPS